MTRSGGAHDVSSVAERKFDVAKSVGLVEGIPVVTLGALYLIACGSGNDFVC
jgi:hypothetical protein